MGLESPAMQATVLVEAAPEQIHLECETCGAGLDLGPHLRTATCPYCASPAVVERPPDANRPLPIFALAFVLPREAALEIAHRWVKGRWFAPQAFRRASVGDTRGVYLPAYLYSAAAHAEYSAEIGENYTVTETYTDSQGKTQTRTRTETEWFSFSGRYAGYVDDVTVTASRGIPNEELAAIEPFDLRALHRYSAKVISGWISEEPSVGIEECVATARGEAIEAVGTRLGHFMPGDTYRSLQHRTWLEQEDAQLVLLPVWVLAVRYREDKPMVRLLVNGQTGRLYGKRPLSWVKVVSLVLIALLAIGLVVWRVSQPRRHRRADVTSMVRGWA
jgi:hypothetical protein